MEEQIGDIQNRPQSFAEVCFKKSSSKDGNVGVDVTVKAFEGAKAEEITKICDIAFEKALKTFKASLDKL